MSNTTSIWAIGNNSDGQLGIGNLDNQTSLLNLAWSTNNPQININSIKCGNSFTYYIDTLSGKYYVSGNNKFGQCIESTIQIQKDIAEIKFFSSDLFKEDFIINPYISHNSNSIFCVCSNNNNNKILYVNGQNDYSQLGISKSVIDDDNKDDKTVNEPCEIPFFKDKNKDLNIQSISSGMNHTLILCDNGNIYSSGSSQYGQNGHGVQSTTSFKRINIKISILKASCGNSFSVLLDNAGTLFSFGFNKNGELGRNDFDDDTSIKDIQYFSTNDNITVIDIKCGNNHTLALTNNGNVYSWGLNKDGQCGYGVNDVNNHDDICLKQPMRIKLFKTNHIEIKEIKCGSHHSLCKTKRNDYYMFGSNAYGQCLVNNNDIKAIYEPFYVNNKVFMISLKENINGIELGNECTYLILSTDDTVDDGNDDDNTASGNFESMDKALGRYYNKMGRNDYYDKRNIGMFMKYVTDNKCSDSSSEIFSQLNNPSGVIYTDFDDYFPSSIDMSTVDGLTNDDINKQKYNEFVLCLQNAFKYGDCTPAITNNDEINKYLNKINKQNNILFNNINDNKIYSLLLTGNKNNIPLLTWIISVYSRYINTNIQYIKNKKMDIYIPSLIKSSVAIKKIKELLSIKSTSGIIKLCALFYKHYGYDLDGKTYKITKINDKITKIAKYLISVLKFIKNIKTTTPEHLCSQINFIIIPHSVKDPNSNDVSKLAIKCEYNDVINVCDSYEFKKGINTADLFAKISDLYIKFKSKIKIKKKNYPNCSRFVVIADFRENEFKLNLYILSPDKYDIYNDGIDFFDENNFESLHYMFNKYGNTKTLNISFNIKAVNPLNEDKDKIDNNYVVVDDVKTNDIDDAVDDQKGPLPADTTDVDNVADNNDDNADFDDNDADFDDNDDDKDVGDDDDDADFDDDDDADFGDDNDDDDFGDNDDDFGDDDDAGDWSDGDLDVDPQQIVLAPRRKDTTEKFDADAFWVCEQCSFKNAPDQAVCMSCKHDPSKPVKKDNDDQKGGFQNDPTNSVQIYSLYNKQFSRLYIEDIINIWTQRYFDDDDIDPDEAAKLQEEFEKIGKEFVDDNFDKFYRSANEEQMREDEMQGLLNQKFSGPYAHAYIQLIQMGFKDVPLIKKAVNGFNGNIQQAIAYIVSRTSNNHSMRMDDDDDRRMHRNMHHGMHHGGTRRDPMHHNMDGGRMHHQNMDHHPHHHPHHQQHHSGDMHGPILSDPNMQQHNQLYGKVQQQNALAMDAKIKRLTEMGYDQQDAQDALQKRQGDIDSAIEYIGRKKEREAAELKRKLAEQKKKKLYCYNIDEMTTIIKVIFDDKFSAVSYKLATSLMEHYEENGYDWADIVDDFVDGQSKDDNFSIDHVIDVLQQNGHDLAGASEQMYIWGLLKRCKPRMPKDKPKDKPNDNDNT